MEYATHDEDLVVTGDASNWYSYDWQCINYFRSN